MRTITYGGAVSLDGFLAGADGALDWLHFSKDVQLLEYFKDVDTILMGRKTYEVSAAQTKPARKKISKPKQQSLRRRFERAERRYARTEQNRVNECRPIDGGCILANYEVVHTN